MAGFAYFASVDAGRMKFAAAADDALARIEGRIDLHLSLLRATRAYFDIRNGQVSRSEFSSFIKGLDIDKTYTGLRGIGFLRLAEKADDAAVERYILEQYGITRKIWPETGSPRRFPVVLFEPLSVLDGIGFDMYSDPLRREPLDHAISEKGMRATGRLQLGQVAGGTPSAGFLVFLRLNGDAPAAEVEEPAGRVNGLLYAAFRANEIFDAALGQTPLLPVNVEVYEGNAEPDNLLFRSQVKPNSSLAESHLVTRRLVVAGQPWTVLFRPTDAFSVPSSRIVPITFGLVGLVLAGAIAMLARWQNRAYSAVQTLQNTTEKSLLEKELMLQEMKHRIKNSIARVLAIARQTANHAKNIDDFSASFASRLRAMAASQDMLTRSRWQRADLEELLTIELEQVFGKGLEAGTLSGPSVELDETTTQALGLTFHELATNALKYGDVGRGKGGLKVIWQVDLKARSPDSLLLTWSEASEEPLSAP